MIGYRIKQLRENKGFSLTELAKQANVSKSYLSQLERGLQSNPSMQFLKKVAIPLEVSIDYLLDDESVNYELDKEWKALIQSAIENGLKKEAFREYLNYVKFQAWLDERNKT
ncbi:helix-turn-helix domain-containing protein [Neobacillus novalis]|uniref:Helix-turn-helix domain-containing protein n=1 Tax=Neobacillus novalis TaxID=220687 RepID=A0AA95MJK4_9BACI|nr:helix-turn-helix domain-containing protein [Neobacillus novalis]WHY84332.1 helix-turn-helix domain-containing protein [Neobacillus novalis]